MNKQPHECAHETIYFGSGDYYLFCRDCDGRWGRLGFGIDAVDSSQSNRGIGATLSGQDRVVRRS